MSKLEVIAEIEKLRDEARVLNMYASELYPSDDAVALLYLLAKDQDIRAVARGEYPRYSESLTDWLESSVYHDRMFGAPLLVPIRERGVHPAMIEAIAACRELADDVNSVEGGAMESVEVSSLFRKRSFIGALNDLASFGADRNVLGAYLLLQMKAEVNSGIRAIGTRAFQLLDSKRPLRDEVDFDEIHEFVLGEEGVGALQGVVIKLRKAAKASLQQTFGSERRAERAMHALEFVLFLKSSEIKLPSRQRANKLLEIREPVLKALATGDLGEALLQMKKIKFTYPELVPAISTFKTGMSESDRAFLEELVGDEVKAARAALVSPSEVARRNRAEDRVAAVAVLREHNRFVFFDAVHPRTLHWYVNATEVDQNVHLKPLVSSVNEWRHIRLSVLEDGDGVPFVFKTSTSKTAFGDKPLPLVNALSEKLEPKEDPTSDEPMRPEWYQIGASAVRFDEVVGTMPLKDFLGEDGFNTWIGLRQTVGVTREIALPVARERRLPARDLTLFG